MVLEPTGVSLGGLGCDTQHTLQEPPEKAMPARDAPREAGWWDPVQEKWFAAGRGLSTGNNAWAMLALIDYYCHTGEQVYLDDAERIANWIDANCRAPVGGGYVLGLGEDGKPRPGVGMVKSTEHNIDVYQAFSLLAREFRKLGRAADADKCQGWADEAGDFVLSKADPIHSVALRYIRRFR